MFRIISGRGREVQGYKVNQKNQWFIVQQAFKTMTPTITQTKGEFISFGRSLRWTPYSKHLIELIHACLAFKPNDRAKARDILGYATVALQTFDQLNANHNINIPVNFAGGSPPLFRLGWPRLTQAEQNETLPGIAMPETVVPTGPASSDPRNIWFPTAPESGNQVLVFNSVVQPPPEIGRGRNLWIHHRTC